MARTSKAAENSILAAAMARTAADQIVEEDHAPAAAPVAAAKPKALKAPVNVTYIPLEDGDKPFTIWQGIKFRANVPVPVTNAEVVALAKQNPWFSVAGKPPVERAPQIAPRDTSEDRQSIPEPKGEIDTVETDIDVN